MTDSRGQPVSSVLSFYFRDEVLPYYAGDIVRRARSRGERFQVLGAHAARLRSAASRVFDYGRSKRRHRLVRFQAQLGIRAVAARLRIRAVKRDSIPQNNPLNPKYRAMIALWKRLPRAAANALGPHIVRGLG